MVTPEGSAAPAVTPNVATYPDRRRAWLLDPRRSARRVWWTAAAGLNLALLPAAIQGWGQEASLAAVLLAVLARHDGLVSALGRLTEHWSGYRRHHLLYHLGQFHRGMAVSAVAWLAVTAVSRPPGWVSGLLGVAMAALAVVGWTARDRVRGTRHERFESLHRYLGWSVLALLVALIGGGYAQAVAAGRPGDGLVGVLLLGAVVALIAHPWASVRRLPVELLAVTPSIVVLALPGGRRVGEFVRVSLEGRQWHSFAASTCGREGPERFCLVIRRAGDWTESVGRLCEAGRPPRWLFVRQLRGYGFMGHLRTYRRTLVVATGAGIGPVLLYLLDRRQPGLRCLWIARDHRAAAGADLVDRVLAAGQTTLVDTGSGRPELTDLIGDRLEDADAVFVVSNASVRDQVAATCAARGVRWYGPTFDS